MDEYWLYIDIEAVHPDDGCERPVDEVCLCGSTSPTVVEDLFSEIQNFKAGDWDMAEKDRPAVEYTVFMHKTDEDDSDGYREEWNLGRYLDLEKAKKFMARVVRKFGK